MLHEQGQKRRASARERANLFDWLRTPVDLNDTLLMSAASLIQLASACVGILGALFFAIGVMRQTVEAMARLSGSYWGWNPHMPPALAAQKADYLFGGGLIVTAFILQLVSYFASAHEVLTRGQARVAPWIAVIATLIAYYVLRVVSRRVAKHYEAQIAAWIKASWEKPK